MSKSKPDGPLEPGKRTKSRVWREGPGDFRFEVVDPGGNRAGGSGFKTEASAKKAASSVTFA
jgi:hypothetical protein